MQFLIFHWLTLVYQCQSFVVQTGLFSLTTLVVYNNINVPFLGYCLQFVYMIFNDSWQCTKIFLSVRNTLCGFFIKGSLCILNIKFSHISHRKFMEG
jgi:hypothetical protein